MMFWRAVTRDEALLRAQRAAEAEGLTWRDPVRISRFLGTYHVTANAMARGGAIHVALRARDGEVLSVKVTPR